MDGNLTLKIDDSVLKKAMGYAYQKGIDLSTVVEDFLTKFVSEINPKPLDKVLTKKNNRQLPERFRKSKGVLSRINDIDSSKDARLHYLLEKYK